MRALIQFWQRGAEDADRRVAAILATPRLVSADRYLMSSIVVRAIDRCTTLLRHSLAHSQVVRIACAAHTAWLGTDWAERYRAIGIVLLIAVGLHVAATVVQHQPPGWFWLIVPGLTSVFAVLLLMASRSAHSRPSPQ